MNNPDLSIIIPVYNAAKFIARCIESIINLNLINVEVILIDDGSTDDSGSICDEYAAKYDLSGYFTLRTTGKVLPENRSNCCKGGIYWICGQ